MSDHPIPLLLFQSPFFSVHLEPFENLSITCDAGTCDLSVALLGFLASAFGLSEPSSGGNVRLKVKEQGTDAIHIPARSDYVHTYLLFEACS